MSLNDPKRTLAAILPDWCVGCPGTATPRELTDPGLWRGDDERIIVTFRAAAHSEASAATLTECVPCASERRVEHGYFPDVPTILSNQERRV